MHTNHSAYSLLAIKMMLWCCSIPCPKERLLHTDCRLSLCAEDHRVGARDAKEWLESVERRLHCEIL
jgi:hypothetical protein